MHSYSWQPLATAALYCPQTLAPLTPNTPLQCATKQARFTDRLIGRVNIPVADVVRNGRLKDSFALQDAESGTIEMKLEWANCYVDDYVE